MDLLSLALLVLIGFVTCCCSSLPCDYCDSTPPNTMRVAIGGLANNVCADCATLDGTYDCVRDPTSPANNCYWHYYFPASSNCNAYSVSVFVNNSDSSGAASPGTMFVRLRFYSGGILEQDIFWSTTRPITSGTTIIDCNFSGLNVPFERNYHVLTDHCTGAAATCTVDAIP